jgi:hypothetical protein
MKFIRPCTYTTAFVNQKHAWSKKVRSGLSVCYPSIFTDNSTSPFTHGACWQLTTLSSSSSISWCDTIQSLACTWTSAAESTRAIRHRVYCGCSAARHALPGDFMLCLLCHCCLQLSGWQLLEESPTQHDVGAGGSLMARSVGKLPAYLGSIQSSSSVRAAVILITVTCMLAAVSATAQVQHLSY